MPRIDDCWGSRWTVRARHERHAPIESDGGRRAREPALQARLGAAICPQPGSRAEVDASPAWSGTEDDHWDGYRDVGASFVCLDSLGSLIPAIWRGIRFLTEPSDDFWVVELAARGRIRRGATWRVGGPDEATQVVSVVADAVRLGQVPQPESALLIDVVDERLTVYGVLR